MDVRKFTWEGARRILFLSEEKEKKLAEREELLKNNEEEFKKEVKRFTDIVLQFKNG